MKTLQRAHALRTLAAFGLLATPLACNGGGAEDGFSSTTLTGDGDGDDDTTSITVGGDGDPGPGECGDGVVNDGEDCDLGGANSDSGQCTTNCTLATCGDGFVWEGYEECDDGNNANGDECTNACEPGVCGDGYLQPGEQCDDGNDDETDGCTSYCLPTYCGDMVLQVGEQCDDGNMITTDECPACQFAFCGDGFLQAGVEACDDGNIDPSDNCTYPLCQPATCGDGIVREGVETCDDGNDVDTDECPTTCQPAYCGDGFVNLVGGEECDDANMIEDDFCQSDCTSNGIAEDFETGDFSLLPWVLTGSSDWSVSSNMPNGGMYAAESGTITHNQQNSIEFDVFIPNAGVVQFWRKTSSEGSFDFLRFYIDNMQQGQWSGVNGAWTQEEFPITMGMHTLRWAYSKDGSVNSGSDKVWVDDIVIGAAPP